MKQRIIPLPKGKVEYLTVRPKKSNPFLKEKASFPFPSQPFSRLIFFSIIILAALAVATAFAACENPWMKDATAPLYKDKDGGSNGGENGEDNPFPVFTLRSIAEAGAWIDGQTALGYGVSAASPILLPPLAINLAASAPDGWAGLLAAIQTKGKFVELDLTYCGMGGVTEFDPGNTNTGKDKIVSLILPDTVKSIKAGTYNVPAFQHFTALESVAGAQVTGIGSCAFLGCTGLTELSLPAVTYIGELAFSGCTGLTAMNLPANPPLLEAGVFSGTYDESDATTLNIYVPAGAVDAYTAKPISGGWGVPAESEPNGNSDVYGSNHKQIVITDTP
jgi:hypothetical protein